MSRRNVFQTLGALTILVGVTSVALLMPANRAQGFDERRLTFYHTHTRQTLQVTYARGGEYDADALAKINRFLKDFRSGDATEIDPALLDVIYDLRNAVGGSGTYQVISAYRSPQTNEMLRSSSGGVARKSQHLLGKAIDVRLTGVDTEELRDAAIAMQRGGVGYYQNSDFIHIDTGRVRRW